MSDATGRQNSSEVAHEAEDVRADLAHTLEQLRENLKPEHVVEEVMSNARLGASSFADGLYAIAKDNPLPALLIGAGAAMVMGLSSHFGLRGKSNIHLRRMEIGGLKGRGRPGLIDAQPVTSPPDNSGGLWSPYRNIGSRPGERRGAATPPLTTAQDMMDRSAGQFPPAGGRTTSRLADVLRDQPLIIAALGVAVGAAIGAALPGTDVEDGLMGGTSASVKQAATDAARSEIEEIRAVASRAAESMKHSATDHGLSADNLSDFVQDVGDHAKSAIHDVGGTTANGQK